MENKINVNGFIQVCIVVEDIETALDYWTKLFNIVRPQITESDAPGNSDLTYRGEIAHYSMKMAVMEAGNLLIELV